MRINKGFSNNRCYFKLAAFPVDVTLKAVIFDIWRKKNDESNKNATNHIKNHYENGENPAETIRKIKTFFVRREVTRRTAIQK